MCIGTPGTERTESGQQRRVSGPGFGGARQAEFSVAQVQPRVFDLTVERRHPRLVLKLQQDFDQAGQPGSRFKVPDIALDRTDAASLALTRAIGRAQCVDLDRIAQSSAGAVGFHIIDLAGVHTGLA
ncbi:hypothetical protein D3C75_667570 [compost metagenome]